MSATLSILGLYSYDQTIFDGMSVPTGIDKQNLISNICLELAEFEILYPNAATMKQAIEFWSAKQLPVWNKLFDSTRFDYDPISNYDRKEEWAENETESKHGSHEESRDSTGSGTGKSTATGNNKNSGTDTAQTDVSAFNETSLSPKDKQTTTLGTQTDTSTTTNAENSAKQTESADGSTSENGSRDNMRTGHAYGNIGVTTTQQMIEQERQTVKFNTIDYIIADFKRRFCLLIY